MTTMAVTVSGKTFWGCLDPRATDVPREAGWPKPMPRRAGRGTRWTFDMTREQAEELLEHLETVGVSFTQGSDDPDSRAEGRAILRDAQRIRSLLTAHPEENRP